jgi:C_GCAxxG_C_C family probable redox protein
MKSKYDRREFIKSSLKYTGGFAAAGLILAGCGISKDLKQNQRIAGAEYELLNDYFGPEDKTEKAVSFLRKYHSCCTGVVATFAPEFGMDEVLAARLTRGMPGIGGSGNVCGTVSGAALIICLATTNESNLFDSDAQQKTLEIIREFISKFENIYPSTQCKDILGHDISSREKFRIAEEKGYFAHCHKVVENAVTILEELLATI